MRGVNKVILIGNTGQEPQIRYTRDGTAVANASLAVGESWNDSQGQKQERTEWVRLVFWGKLAEIVKEYVGKGTALYVEGKMQTRSWENKEGKTQYTTEVNVKTMNILGGWASEGGGGGGGGGYQDQPREPFQATDDDVPF